jgi:methionyl-tRNA formyltransferase
VPAQGLALGDHAGEPGQIAALETDGTWVCCGQGSLRLGQLQRPDRRAMPAPDVLRGARLGVGARLDAVAVTEG